MHLTYNKFMKQYFITKDSKRSNKYRRKEYPNIYEKSLPCLCLVCHHSAFENHSQICRTNNNNNSLPPSSVCLCSKSTSSPTFPVINSYKNSLSASGSSKEKLRNPYVAILMAFAFLALPFLPATNIFFYVGFVVAERVLYLPSVGYCLLISIGISRVLKVKKYARFVCFFLIFLLIVFCVRTIRRNRDWKDEESLYRSAITINPPKGKKFHKYILSSILDANQSYKRH